MAASSPRVQRRNRWSFSFQGFSQRPLSLGRDDAARSLHQSGGAKTEGASMKIQLPIDISAVSFIAVMPPEPVLDRQTRQQQADADGEPLYSIELVCVGAEG